MNDVFENMLLEKLKNDKMCRLYPDKMDKYFQQVFNQGAWGEIGNNYYLFIYKSYSPRNCFYDAVIFIHTPFDLENSLKLMVTNEYESERQISNFICMAIYFLIKKIPNTLNFGDVKRFYNDLKKIIQDCNEKEDIKKKELENFNFDIRNQTVKVSELHLKKPVEQIANPTIINKIQQLKTSINEQSQDKECAPARLGLCLEISGNRTMNFHFFPIIIPLKKNNTYGPPKFLNAFHLKKFNFEGNPDILREYAQNLFHHSLKWDIGTFFKDVITRFYFEKMAQMVIEMPDELTFYCESKINKNLLFLKKIIFKKMAVKFVPTSNGDQMNIFLEITALNGQVFQPGLNFKVSVSENSNCYLFFKILSPKAYQANDYDYMTCNQEACLAAPEQPGKFAPFFRFLSEFKKISINDFKRVCDILLEISSDILAVYPAPLPLYYLEYRPTPVLKICEEINNLPKFIEVTFDYETKLQEFLIENPHIQASFQKNTQFEDMCFLLLKMDPLLKIDRKERYNCQTSENEEFFFFFENNDDIRWLIERGSVYLEKGFKIYSMKKKQYIGNPNNTLHIEIRSNIKWLEFKPVLKDAVTGESIELDPVDFYNQIVNDKKERLYLLKKEDIDKLSRYYKYAEKHGDIFRIPSENYFLINELYDKRMEEIPQLKEKLGSAKKLESFKKIPSYELPEHFNGELRKYQEAGYQWLHFLQEYKLPGCLADDMGLGKTVQTLALLQKLKNSGKLSASLLVVPVSAIPNWEAEINKFTPGLTVYRHMGNIRSKSVDNWDEFDLVITSYATLRNDVDLFKDFSFYYIILDESQNIKNYTSQTSMAIKLLKGKHRLALSGTPIENNSLELWSLFDFLLPGFLGTHNWFKKQWTYPIEKNKDSEKAGLLKKMVYPFILRRKKEDVEKELPEKIEIVQALQMEEKQMKLYAATATYYRKLIDNEIKVKGLEKSSLKILEGMLRLRQVCLFPHLIDEKYENIPAIKFDYFINLLEDILSVDHKVLVFSQFVKVLDILRDYLDRQHIKYSYIDGSINLKDRAKNVKDFQEKDDHRIFLLSLKAGGVALNLTAADYVIIFDPWWNPAVENQAVDRSYRIGQTRKVIVYRMVVKNTIEEKMLALQDQKKELVEQLI
ncbi:MAG: DEAD/DEAH box helicase, partial [Acidobacteria bacterium]|nr:DEAD/DEAH box helicase [Acidobacteriota bacterium]